MATELTMPQMGYDMQEGTVLRWLKGEGDAVANGEPIAEIETDKAVVEFESYADGVLHRIIVPAGTTVPVGQPIAVVGGQDESIESSAGPSGDAAEDEAASAPVEDESDDAPSAAIPMPPASTTIPEEESSVEPAPAVEEPSAPAAPLRASPIARRIADERGIDISKVTGTGPGGRIVKDDVLAYEEPEPEEPEIVEEPEPEVVEEQPAAEIAVEEPSEEMEEPEEEVEPEIVEEQPQPVAEVEPEPEPVAEAADGMALSRMRQQIARVTVRSKQEKPHFYVTSEVDMTDAMNLRQQINRSLEGEGMRVTVNDLIIKACADALKKHPKFNAFLDDDVIRPNDSVNIGIAMAVEEGLLMPAIMGCEQMTLKSLALASKDLADRAQNGTLRPDEYTGGTFGISNLGMFDVSTFVAIIQPPQTAILAVGTVAKRPVVRDDEIVIRQTMNATISADHRVVDGAEGAQFLIEVKNALENPLSLIL